MTSSCPLQHYCLLQTSCCLYIEFLAVVLDSCSQPCTQPQLLLGHQSRSRDAIALVLLHCLELRSSCFWLSSLEYNHSRTVVEGHHSHRRLHHLLHQKW